MADSDDLLLLLGFGIVGYIAYDKWYKGQNFDSILKDVDTKLRAFLDDIASKLPELPPPPTFTPPTFDIPQAPPPPVQQTPVQEPEVPVSNTPTPSSKNTIPDADEPEEKSPQKVPVEESGQLPVNPPPSSISGTVVGFAGDFDNNGKAKQTVQIMQKQGVQQIVGCGDYGYDSDAATWYNNIIAPLYKGKMKGAVGNHDGSGAYLGLFGQTGWNFTQNYGPNLSVVFIDTERGIEQQTLDNLTKAAKAQSKHVAYAMHKAYVTSSDGHHKPSENKWGAAIDAVAKKYGVKLVVAGHNHVYEHAVQGGIHYVTSGAAGRKFYTTGCKIAGAVKCFDNVNGFLKVTAAPDRLLCQFVTHSGSVSDSFVIGATAAQQRSIVQSYYVNVFPYPYNIPRRNRQTENAWIRYA